MKALQLDLAVATHVPELGDLRMRLTMAEEGREKPCTPQTWRHLRLQCHPDDIQAQSAKICCQKESSP